METRVPTFALPPHPSLHLQPNPTPPHLTPPSSVHPPPSSPPTSIHPPPSAPPSCSMDSTAGHSCSSHHAKASDREASWWALGVVRGAGQTEGGDGGGLKVCTHYRLTHSHPPFCEPASLSHSVIQPFIILSAFLLSCLQSIICSPIIYLYVFTFSSTENTHTHIGTHTYTCSHTCIYIFICIHAHT